MGFDLVIEGGTLVTMDGQRRVLPDGIVGICGECIEFVGTKQQLGSYEARHSIDARGMCVLPGLIDTHGHAGHNLTKTMAESSAEGWEPVVEDVYLRGSTEQFWYVDAQLGAIERLKFGVTCGYSMLGNMPRADDAVYSIRHMQGADCVGTRDILGIGPANPPWPKQYKHWRKDGIISGEYDLHQALETTEKVLKTWRTEDFGRALVHVSPSRIGNIPGLEPHMIEYQTREVVRLAKEYDTMINAHAYAGNIIYASKHLDVLGPNLVLAHCTGISDEEVKILAATGTHVSCCPSARAYSRARCPLVELLDQGTNVAVGTDGSAPDRTFDLFKDMRTAILMQRAHFADTSYIPAGKALEMVTCDAARALGLERQLGSIEKGKWADIVLVNVQQPHLYPWAMPVHRLVFEASGQDVDTVIVAGKVLMQARQVKSVDERAVLDAVQREFERMLESTGNRRHLEPPEGFWGSSRYPNRPQEE